MTFTELLALDYVHMSRRLWDSLADTRLRPWQTRRQAEVWRRHDALWHLMIGA